MGENTAARHEIAPETRRAIRAWIVQTALGLIGYGLILFISAGTLDWAWGWVLLGVLAAFLAGHVAILVPNNPELLAERQKGLRDPDVPRWDRWIAALAAGVFPVASWIVAGLDVRFGWTGTLSLWVHLFGLLGMVIGFSLFLWALGSNAFFAEGVHIQEERGHAVATSGPYSYVRHPGYAGAILALLATPFMLGSIWALIPAAFGVTLYVLRTYLEDETLQEELSGYADYARQTRYRLVPGVW